MSRNYDNWERLVAAVIKKQQLWQLFHEQSRSPSLSSQSSSSFTFSLGLNSSIDDDLPPITFPSPDFDSSIVDKGQSPVKNDTFRRSRKRDLKIEVPTAGDKHELAFSHVPENCTNNISPRTYWPDGSKQQSYPLPLPPVTNSNSSPSSSSRPSSTATSPSAALPRSPVISPGSNWKKGKFIDRGKFGDVYIGFNSETGEMCAMKEVTLFADDAKSKQSARQLQKEITLLSSLRHPNIVQYNGSETVGDKFYIYLEYVSGGSIHNILQQYGKLGESAIRSYTQQILSGLAYLHSKSVAHRDIKGANILVDPNGSVKLANFGIAKHIAEQSDPSVSMASSYWMAPEVIMNPSVRNLSMDIWSLGCTVLEMATSRPPMSQYEWMVAMFKVGNHKELPTIPDHLSDEGKDFLRRCLLWDPLHRATASQLLEHPFVKSLSSSEKQIPVSTSSSHPAVTNAVKSVGNHHARSSHQFDLRRLATHSSGASTSNFHPSDICTPRNISLPVSPVGSLLLHASSPQHMNGRISPPSTSSSTRAIGGLAYPDHLNPSISRREKSPNQPKHNPGINSPSSYYWDPNILRGSHSKSHSLQEPASSRNNDAVRNNLGRTASEQLVLADRVSQKLLSAPVKLNSSSSRLPSYHMPRVL